MRRLAANYVFPVSSHPIKNGIIEVDDDGTISQIIDPGAQFRELRKVEFYNGILVPGFVNCHCHLELSALKGYLKQNSGLPSFIQAIRKYRNRVPENELLRAIRDADREMYYNGIRISADISNTDYSFETKAESKIHYYNFIEVFGLSAVNRKKNYRKALNLHKKLSEEFQLKGNLTPHAPYSLASKLFRDIFSKPGSKKPLFSFHYRECSPKTEKRLRRRLKFSNLLKNFHFSVLWEDAFKNDYLSLFPGEDPCLLVHNTYAGMEDIKQANDHFSNLYWILCPNSNLFIEGKIPDINLFVERSQRLAIGTDSLASNHKLSVLDELITLQKHFPDTSLEDLILWATLNGAKALKADQLAGSFEPGKRPGVNLLYDLDLPKWKLTENTKVKTIL